MSEEHAAAIKRERVVITIRPQPSDDGLLKVEDAMRQVLDVLGVVGSAGRSLDAQPSETFDWRLESASANSPFKIVAVAEAKNPGVNVSHLARLAKHESATAFRALADQRSLPTWLDRDGTVALRNLYERSLNGIAATSIDFDEGDLSGEPVTGRVEINTEVADLVLGVLEAASPLSDMHLPARSATGELDGHLVAVGRWRKQPALQVFNPLYGAVWCVVRPELVARLGGERTLEEVWSGRRVAVKGRLHYAAGGRLLRVAVEGIREKAVGTINLDDVLDANFTAGLDPVDYLDRLHDGSLA